MTTIRKEEANNTRRTTIHRSSVNKCQLTNCEIRSASSTTAIMKLATFPQQFRVHRICKDQRNIPQKYASAKYQAVIVLLGAAKPELFISHAITVDINPQQFYIAVAPILHGKYISRFDSYSHQTVIDNYMP